MIFPSAYPHRLRRFISPGVTSLSVFSISLDIMGGKTWSFDEEKFFWHEIIPQSPKGVNPVDRIMDWEACARRMQASMGENARRKYTKLMLCEYMLRMASDHGPSADDFAVEHYFQNVSTGHMSPHALAFVNEHKRHLGTSPTPVLFLLSGQLHLPFRFVPYPRSALAACVHVPRFADHQKQPTQTRRILQIQTRSPTLYSHLPHPTARKLEDQTTSRLQRYGAYHHRATPDSFPD